jgi:hypothetical protein
VKNEIIGHGAWIVVETLPITFVAREGCCRFNNSWPPMDHVKSCSPTGASLPAAYLAQVEYQLNGWRDAGLGRSGIGSLPIANCAGPTQATVVPDGAEPRLAWRASPDLAYCCVPVPPEIGLPNNSLYSPLKRDSCICSIG